MYPTLIELGPLTIHTYGLAIALAFIIGILLATHQAEKEGINPEKILDLGFYLMIAAIIGSRLLFVLLEYKAYVDNPWRIFKIWEGGLVFYGGLIAAVITGSWYIRKHGLPFWKTADIVAPSIAIGQGIGRLGCFAAGCCYGKLTELPWAVTFRHPESLAPIGVALHPTQLYESLLMMIIFGLLVIIRKVRHISGQVFLSYIILYSIARFGLEFFRGDPRGSVTALGYILSTSQIISVIGLVIALAGLWFFTCRRPANLKQ